MGIETTSIGNDLTQERSYQTFLHETEVGGRATSELVHANARRSRHPSSEIGFVQSVSPAWALEQLEMRNAELSGQLEDLRTENPPGRTDWQTETATFK